MSDGAVRLVRWWLGVLGRDGYDGLMWSVGLVSTRIRYR